MTTAFENFMSGLIDYAGAFPPAGLAPETAAGNYADYLGGNAGWMLGRCILPATGLHRVTPRPGLRCSVIVSPAVDRDELARLNAFTTSQGRVEMVETRLPETDGSPAGYAGHLLQLESGLAQAGLQGVQLFVEAESLAVAAPAIADFNGRRGGGKTIRKIGYKLRCGGLEKQTFPTPEKVAEVIGVCREHDIPMKFTAGMHHPLRNRSRELETMQHGFINVFAAALLAWDSNLGADEIAACLADENGRHFLFADDAFSWRERTISAGAIKRLRTSKVISFGSCSFAEPVEGLHSLGYYRTTGD